MNIGFDLDGVLYPWHESLHEYLVNYHGLELDFENFWKNYNRISSEKVMRELVLIRHLYDNKSILPEHVEMLNELSVNNTLFYITSRNEKELRHVTEKNLKRCNVPQRDNLFFSHNKAIEVSLYEIDFFVDDLPHHIQRLLGYTTPILVRTPYNEYFKDDVLCVSNLLEVKNIFGGN